MRYPKPESTTCSQSKCIGAADISASPIGKIRTISAELIVRRRRTRVDAIVADDILWTEVPPLVIDRRAVAKVLPCFLLDR